MQARMAHVSSCFLPEVFGIVEIQEIASLDMCSDTTVEVYEIAGAETGSRTEERLTRRALRRPKERWIGKLSLV